jgi:preprotein translocase subunit SecG
VPRFPAFDDGELSTVLMTFLLVVHGLLALALVGVILLQKSEGGGLTGGGSAGGLVSARGAADLLSRSTAILATLFIVSSLGLAWLAAQTNQPRAIDTTLAREAPPVGPPMARFIFITGGVVSSLGKGLMAAALVRCCRRAATRSAFASSIPISTSIRAR